MHSIIVFEYQLHFKITEQEKYVNIFQSIHSLGEEKGKGEEKEEEEKHKERKMHKAWQNVAHLEEIQIFEHALGSQCMQGEEAEKSWLSRGQCKKILMYLTNKCDPYP